jgi:lysozyme family protein
MKGWNWDFAAIRRGNWGRPVTPTPGIYRLALPLSLRRGLADDPGWRLHVRQTVYRTLGYNGAGSNGAGMNAPALDDAQAQHIAVIVAK